jgi:hypothetical protein
MDKKSIQKVYELSAAMELLDKLGLVYEINRCILHPLGFSFYHVPDSTGKVEKYGLLEVKPEEEIRYENSQISSGEGKLQEYLLVAGNTRLYKRYKEFRKNMIQGGGGDRLEKLAEALISLQKAVAAGESTIPEGELKAAIDEEIQIKEIPIVLPSDDVIKNLIESARYTPLYKDPVKETKPSETKLPISLDNSAVVPDNLLSSTALYSDPVANQELAKETAAEKTERLLTEKYSQTLHARPDGGGMCRTTKVSKETIPGGGSIVMCRDCGAQLQDSDLRGS